MLTFDRACLHTLRGHTSTVRCLKMADANTAISGSRDTTLRIWDIRTGLCRNVLVGHQSSVRCLEIKGDIVVSGSYDTFARVWSISEGRCLQTLQGHFSQIYAIAFDGKRVVTGSLDTNVRVWDPMSGYVVPCRFCTDCLKLMRLMLLASVLPFSKDTRRSSDSYRCEAIRSSPAGPTGPFAFGLWRGCVPFIVLPLTTIVSPVCSLMIHGSSVEVATGA